jgi:sn-glycerol 3-phosphate transport system permease protein
MTDSARLRRMALSCVNTLVKLLVVLVILFPFYWLIITSLKTYKESISVPATFWPSELTYEAYVQAFSSGNLLVSIRNTVIVTFAIIIIQTLVMVPAAYAFAKYTFWGKNILFGLVLLAFMIPIHVTCLPLYLMMTEWGILGTLWPQILPFGANAFGIFLLRQYFMQVPDEIVEAAQLDNTSVWKTMFRIMVPMAKSTMITIALFSFISHWNSYFWPLIITNSEHLRPITIALERLKDAEQGLNWPIIMAGNVMLILPIIVIYLFASRRIIKAFAYNGMK